MTNDRPSWLPVPRTVRREVRVFLCGCIFLLGIATANAMGPKGKYAVLGQGNRSCGAWAEAHKEENLMGIAQDAWLMGYITSFNRWGNPGGQDISSGITPADLINAVSQECQNTPLDDIASVAERLMTKWRVKKPQAAGPRDAKN